MLQRYITAVVVVCSLIRTHAEENKRAPLSMVSQRQALRINARVISVNKTAYQHYRNQNIT